MKPPCTAVVRAPTEEGGSPQPRRSSAAAPLALNQSDVQNNSATAMIPMAAAAGMDTGEGSEVQSQAVVASP